MLSTISHVIDMLTVDNFQFQQPMEVEENNIQLFRERLSDKVHATTAKVIVGGFEFTFFKEIGKNCRKDRGHISASAKGRQQK